MNPSYPARGWGKREPEARRLRSARGAQRRSHGSLRRWGRPHRRLRAVLVVRGGDGHVLGRHRELAVCRLCRPRATRGGAQARNGVSGRARGGSRCGSPPCAPVRGARLRPLHPRRAARLKAKLSTDGGSRGNPGPAAYGYVLEAEDGTVLDARGETIGRATNNVAEYRGLVAGLEKAVELGITELEVVSDSELLVKQMLGDYRVKNETLRELSLDAEALARRIGRVSYTAVRREHNDLADRLVNEALGSAG